MGAVGGAAIGAAFLLWLSGVRPIDPTEVGWVMQFDWVPHYFGWMYFRIEPWQWPPGKITGYYAPFGTSVGLTDSIPLVAYLLKPFGQWLPPHFQYLGAWWLLCFTLQGALAARLIGRWIGSVAVQWLGAALFVLLPMLLARVAHAALCSHWLILWTLLIVSRRNGPRFSAREWAVLGLMAGMIQPYLAAMVLALLGAATLGSGNEPARQRVVALASAVGTTLAGWGLSGLFTLSEGGALSAFGLGFFSMNLLALVSPGGWSQVLPDLPVAGVGQTVEGFHYLGLGMLALVVLALGLHWRGRRAMIGAADQRVWPRAVIVISMLMAAFAVSPRVTFGSAVVVDLSGPWSAPLALFRSSGRFMWPLTYLMVTWAIVTVGRRLSRPWALAVMGAAVAVQAFDLHLIHLDRRQATHGAAFYTWTQPFVSDRWPRIAVHYSHVVLAPPPQCGASALPLAPVVRFAAEHGLTVNTGILARHEERSRARYCEALGRDVDAGRLDPQSLYIVSDERAQSIRLAGRDGVTCGLVDAVAICTASSTYASWRNAVPLD